MRRLLICFVVVMAAVASSVAITVSPAGAVGESWTLRDTPQSSWRAIAHNGVSTFVAVADSGADRVAYSGPLGSFPAAAAANNAWTSVTYGKNGVVVDRFVAVSSNGTDRVMTSTNGATWTSSGDTDTATGAWTSVTWSDDLDLFVAVASSGTNRVMTSPDGVTWTPQTVGVAANSWTSVTWIGGAIGFVAVASDGADRVMTSDDGTTWTSSVDTDTATGAWTSVTSDGTTLVAVASGGTNRAMTSDDGTAWSVQAVPAANQWSSVTWIGGVGKFIAVASTGADRVMTSPDGVTWTLSGDADTDDSAWAAVGRGPYGFIVAVGSNGSPRAMYSTNGTSWTPTSLPAPAWRSVTYGDGLFVAVAGTGTVNRVMTSPDGVTWTERAAASADPWTGVTFGDGRFVAVASTGSDRVMTSDDGIAWEPQTAAAANSWSAVAYGNGRYVAVSSDGIDRVMTSTDGETWALSGDAGDTDDGSWASVTYGGGRFVAVSWDGKVMSSTNGTAWTLHTSPAANPWNSASYGNGRFVAVASGGADRVMTSTNGTSWSLSGDTSVTNDASWTAVTYGGGTFVALSSYGIGNGVMTSTDGLDWTAYTIPQYNSWGGITYHSGLFVAVAASGINPVMTSGAFTLAPTIAEFDPVEGTVGTTVTITGTNFTGTTSVTFDGVDAPGFTVVSATQIRAEVPEGATTGRIAVTNPGGTATSINDFTVTVVSDSVRIFGQDEVDTAIEVAQYAFPNLETATAADDVSAAATDANAVVLARNDFFADALAGGPLAADVNGPLLLTYGAPTDRGDSLPTKVRSEIDRLLAPGATVYILGGPLAISSEVEADVEDAGYDVVRIGRANQFGTAVAIAERIGSPGAIFEATGWNFPDALSAVPAAIDQNGVIVLTDNNVQAPETADYIAAHPKVTRYTIGGDLVAGGADPGAINVSGPDLYGTSAAVAKKWFAAPNEFGVATGNNFPDALSGGVFMATGGRLGPMLLVNGTSLPVPPRIDAYLNGLEPGTTGYFFGGTIAISTSVLNAVMAAVGA